MTRIFGTWLWSTDGGARSLSVLGGFPKCGSGRPNMDDLFLLVLAGHLLGDFIAQTHWQATNKEGSWPADLAHVFTYHLTMALLVVPAWHDWGTLWFLAISTGTDAIVDRRWPTRLVLQTTGSKEFSAVFWG